MRQAIGRTARHASAMLALLVLASSAPAQVSPSNEQAANNGWSFEQNRTPAWHLEQHKRLAAALAMLAPQRKGVVDAYVVAAGLDSDPVFTREASESAKVLARRYDAAGRSITLAAGAPRFPQGSPQQLAITLAAVAQRMDLKEDVLVLFATTHGDPNVGLVYRDGNDGFGMIAPKRLAAMLDTLGFQRRLIFLSACYSGVFVPELANDQTIVVTAAAPDRTSFGCAPGNDWTYFGDAFVNTALRKAQSLDKATVEAITLINQWEMSRGLEASMPQVVIGAAARGWLAALEKRMPPTATAKVGRPAIDDAPVPAGR